MNTCGHSERNYRKSRILRSSIDRGCSEIAGHLRVQQGSGNPGAPFVLDSTACKWAEAEARESELRHGEMQTELAHADRITTIGKLTASISHEVNQPITAMITNAQAALRWLDRQPPDLEEVRQALASVVKDGDRARDVIDRIRALIKKAPPRKDRLEINGAIREVIELTRGEAVKNGVSVRTKLADGLPIIQGDRVHLQQVILNLIVNAIEAMSGISEGRRELLISTSKVEPGVLVAVRDSGPGLPPATLEHVFDPFYTTKASGLGMGLSICRSIIEAHGGRLWASPNVPSGAIFQFTLVEGRNQS
jgi:C4-dicarboxylate-specific signal transduction histidine kinase